MKINFRKHFLMALLFLSGLCIHAKAPQGPESISVVSFNIRMGEAKDGTNSWQLRCPATVYMLDEELPDVFGLQEAYPYQVKFITENCMQYEAYGVGRENGKKQGEQTAIVYNKKKIALLKKGTFWLSETPDKPSIGWDAACKRTATWAIMKDKKSGKKFFFLNTHLDHVGSVAREKGLELILDKISELNTQSLPVVITGDMNVTPDNTSLRPLNENMKCCRLHAKETDHGATFNAWGRKSTVIDYIYFNGFRECSKFKIINKKYGKIPFISDHYPIKAELIF